MNEWMKEKIDLSLKSAVYIYRLISTAKFLKMSNGGWKKAEES